MASQSGGLGHTGPSARGPPSCPVCGRAVGVRQSDDRLRAHGRASNHCPGSGGVPISVSAATPQSNSSADSNQSMDLFDSSLDEPSPPIPTFAPPRSTAKILKRILRGARDVVAAGLQSPINTVLERLEDPQSWLRLWSFAEGCLRQPSERGGKRRNLTSSVLAQTTAFTSAVGLPPLTTAPKRWGEARKRLKNLLTRRPPRRIGLRPRWTRGM